MQGMESMPRGQEHCACSMGCSVRWPVCPAGRALWIDVACGAALIESPAFVQRPVAERDAVWNGYNQAVLAYLRHCGWREAAPARTHRGGQRNGRDVGCG